MEAAALQQGVDQISFTQSFLGAALTPTSGRVKQVPDTCKAALVAWPRVLVRRRTRSVLPSASSAAAASRRRSRRWSRRTHALVAEGFEVSRRSAAGKNISCWRLKAGLLNCLDTPAGMGKENPAKGDPGEALRTDSFAPGLRQAHAGTAPHPKLISPPDHSIRGRPNYMHRSKSNAI